MRQLINPLLLTDFYKFNHIDQYPKGTKQIWCNWTPRSTRVEGATHVVNFGLIPAVFTDANMEYIVRDMMNPATLDHCSFDEVYRNGILFVDPSFEQIRKRARRGL